MKNAEPTPKPDEAAPRPWLSAAAPLGTTTPAQAWSPTNSLTVSYPFVKHDFYRRLVHHMRKNFRRMAPGLAAMSLLFGGVPYLTLWSLSRGHPNVPVPGYVWRMTYISWAMTTLGIPVFSFLLSYATATLTTQITARTAKDKRFFITLSPQGAEQRFDFAQLLRWSEVQKIEGWEGGVLIAGRFGRPQIGVPGSAFPDEAAAERFSEAAHILWKSNGDMGLVPEATRAEFAPSIST